MLSKEKLLINSNVTFGHNVFKNQLMLLRQNASADWKGLTALSVSTTLSHTLYIDVINVLVVDLK